MKLYMVIYIAGLIGGTAGPLPYGEDECHARADAMLVGTNDVETPQGYSRKDIRFACEWHNRRPDNDPKAGAPRERNQH